MGFKGLGCSGVRLCGSRFDTTAVACVVVANMESSGKLLNHVLDEPRASCKPQALIVKNSPRL